MNLLFLTPQLPYPPHQGTAIRNWGLIKGLAARHTVTLLSFAEPGQSADAPELRAACQRIVTLPTPHRSRAARLRTLLSPHPDLARRLWSPEFAQVLTNLLRHSTFDVMHLEGLEMAPYLLTVVSDHKPQSAIGNRQSVYDAHNAEHALQRRAFLTDVRQPARWPAALYSWLQIPRLKKFEAEVCREASRVTCVSAEDAAALQRLVPSLNPMIIPNGIDVEDYTQYTPPNTHYVTRAV
ncbi:MAG: glycosyltransferase, partial [Anaerolineales bacterium]